MSPVAWHPESGPRAWRRRILLCAPFSAFGGWFFQSLVGAHAQFGGQPYAGEDAIAFAAGVLAPPLVVFVGYPLFVLVTDKLADALTAGYGPRSLGPAALLAHALARRRRRRQAIAWPEVAVSLAAALAAELPEGLTAAGRGSALLVVSLAAPPGSSTYTVDLGQLGAFPQPADVQHDMAQVLAEVRDFVASAGGAAWKPAATGSIPVVEASWHELRLRYEAMRRPTGLGVVIPLPRLPLDAVHEPSGPGPGPNAGPPGQAPAPGRMR